MRARSTIAAATFLLAAGCKPSPRRVTLTVAGSTSVQPFAEKWVDAFHGAHPEVEIRLLGGGSSAGVQAVENGTAQIGTCSRELSPEEKAAVTAVPIARDGIAVIVNPKNPVSDLTAGQVRGIYAGAIANWKDVGGPDHAITVVTREDGSGTRGAIEELLMKDAKITTGARVQDSTEAVHAMVSEDPWSIGYISLGQTTPDVKALKLDGVEAGQASIDSGAYPLVRPFLMVVQGTPAGPEKDFIDWLSGPGGRELTRRQGLLPPKQ